MTKPILLISYANSATQHLPNLKREEECVLKVLQDRKSLRDDFEIESPSSREGIVDVLKDSIKRENLLIFSYSGHAAGDRLITEGEETNAEGIATLLSRCPNLALIILNGCSTDGQVAQLFEAFKQTGYNSPIIIATSASVGDKVATDFGITFAEQLLTYGRNVNTAFITAFAIAKTHIEANALREDGREGRYLNKTAKEGTWGMYVADGNDKIEATEKTFNDLSRFNDTSFIPNNRLFKGLIRGLLDFDKDILEIYERNDNVIIEIDPYKTKIYQCFPLPISKRLQRLESSGSSVDEKNLTFFNKIDRGRLGELLRTFQTIIDILFAITQAELYRYIEKNESTIDSSILHSLTKIYNKLDENNKEITLMQALDLGLKIVKTFEKQLIIKELAQLSEIEKNELIELGFYFEKLQNDFPTLSNSECVGLVEFAEIRLSKLFKHILFLSNYNLTSVENILLTRRRMNTPEYKHKLFWHKGGYSESEPMNIKLSKFLDNSSVILHKINKDDINDYGQFLNLSPFLIDDILFEEKAVISNIMAFSKLKKSNNFKNSAHNEVYEYRNLIYGSTKLGIKKVEFVDNTNKNENKIDYENRAYIEIRKEWKTLESKIEKVFDIHIKEYRP